MLIRVSDDLFINPDYVVKATVEPQPITPTMDNRGEPIEAEYAWKVILIMTDRTELTYCTCKDRSEALTQLQAAADWLNQYQVSNR